MVILIYKLAGTLSAENKYLFYRYIFVVKNLSKTIDMN